jgi:hypothetical protein
VSVAVTRDCVVVPLRLRVAAAPATLRKAVCERPCLPTSCEASCLPAAKCPTGSDGDDMTDVRASLRHTCYIFGPKGPFRRTWLPV